MTTLLMQAGAHLTLASSLGSALPDRPSLLENLEFQAIGLVIVMAALSSLYLLSAAVGQVFIRLEARQKRTAESVPSVATEPQQQAAEAVPVAAIAAAVAVTVGGPHRVVEIKPSSAALSWSLEGRRQIFATRLPRR